MLEAEPDQEADHQHQHDDEQVADGVGEGAPGEDGRAGHGRDRKRSIRPLDRSSARPTPVLMAPKVTVWTKIPAIR